MNADKTQANHRIIVIDDNPAIHNDFRKILGADQAKTTELDAAETELFDAAPVMREHVEFEIDCARQGQEGLVLVQQALAEQRPYALAFVDVRMPPGWNGVETVAHLWARDPELQVALCTAYSDYSWDEIVGRIGRTDNLVILKKPFDNIEAVQIACALTKKWLLAKEVRQHLEGLGALARQRTQEMRAAQTKMRQEAAGLEHTGRTLRLWGGRFSKAFQVCPFPLAILSLRELRFVEANDCFLATTGLDRGQVVGQTIPQLPIVGIAGLEALMGRLRQADPFQNQPCRFETQASSYRDVFLSLELFQLDADWYGLLIAHASKCPPPTDGNRRSFTRPAALASSQGSV